MRINTQNITNQSFGLIKLSNKDRLRSEELVKNLIEQKLSIHRRNTISLDLYRIFEPYIQEEGMLKARVSYVLEEVISDIKVKFWEFINDINNNNSVDDLIERIDKYKPRRELLKLKYLTKSFDEPLPNRQRETKVERMTIENLSVPQAEVEKEEIKEKLSKTINEQDITKTTRNRLRKRGKGLTYVDIASDEGVSSTTARRSVIQGVLKMQKINKTLSKENEAKVLNLANVLCIKFNEALNMAIKSIGILEISPQKLLQKVNDISKILRIPQKNVIKILLKNPSLYNIKLETINKNIEFSAKVLDISEEDYIKLALKLPSLFYRKPESLCKNIEASSYVLGISKSDFTKILLRQPSLIIFKPESLNKKVESYVKVLGVQKADFIKAALKQPALLCHKPKTLYENIKSTSRILKISKEDLVKAALKQQTLLSIKPETIKTHIETTSSLLGIPKEEFIRVGLKKPSLICQNSETINENVKTSAKLLGVTREEFIKAALKQSNLFCQRPETIINNVSESANYLGISKEEFIRAAMRKGSLFYQKPTTLHKKVKIINYCRKIKNCAESIKITGAVCRSDEDLYKDLLVYIIQQKCYPNIKLKEIKTRLPELLNSQQSQIVAEIPYSDVAEDFIKFAEGYSKETTGKNVFEFIIREDI